MVGVPERLPVGLVNQTFVLDNLDRAAPPSFNMVVIVEPQHNASSTLVRILNNGWKDHFRTAHRY